LAVWFNPWEDAIKEAKSWHSTKDLPRKFIESEGNISGLVEMTPEIREALDRAKESSVKFASYIRGAYALSPDTEVRRARVLDEMDSLRRVLEGAKPNRTLPPGLDW